MNNIKYAYHVDRWDLIPLDKELQLMDIDTFDNLMNTLASEQNIQITDKRYRSFIEQYFDGKVGRAASYFLFPFPRLDNNNIRYLVELIFEMVRRSNFPHRPSRYQCFYAAPDLQTAKMWKEELGGNSPEFSNTTKIKKIAYQTKAFLADAALLDDNGAITLQGYLCNVVDPSVVFFHAHKYWEGKRYRDVYPERFAIKSRMELLIPFPVTALGIE